MLNGRWITLQSGIDYLPLEAKPLFSYSLSVLAYMMLYLNIFVADILDCSFILYIWHFNRGKITLGKENNYLDYAPLITKT